VGSKVIRNVTKILKATSGRLFGRVTSGTGRAEELTPSQARSLMSVYSTSEIDAIIGGIEGLTSADIDTLAEINAILTDADLASVSYVDSGLSGKQATLVSGTNIKTVNSTSLLGSGNITVGLSGTGSVDNAALRADGTGGATLQSSAWIIADNLTASPNNTVNHACLQATGATTNVSVSIKPKGSGAFSLLVPDGTSANGNARGANAVDLQTLTNSATRVASGTASVVIGGGYNTASGNFATCGGYASSASAESAVAIGDQCVSSADYSFTTNQSNEASVGKGFAHGVYAAANRCEGMYAHASGRFAVTGDAQYVRWVLRATTTNTTPTNLLAGFSRNNRLGITSGKVVSVLCRICGIKSDGSAVANYVRRVVIKNVAGTTSLVGSVETIGTDIEDSPSVTDVTITADNTNDALDISVTGEATWRWLAVVEGLEIAYGT
jgi:hypothetical protein